MLRALQLLRNHRTITVNRNEDPDLLSLLYFLEHHGFVSSTANGDLVVFRLERDGLSPERVLKLYKSENMGDVVTVLSKPKRLSSDVFIDVPEPDLTAIPGAFRGCALSVPDSMKPEPYGHGVTCKREERRGGSNFYVFVSDSDFIVRIRYKKQTIMVVHGVPTIASMFG